MILEKDDARRARGCKKRIVVSRKDKGLPTKTLEGNEAIETTYDDGQLAIGPDVFGAEERVGNVVEEGEGVEVAATATDDGNHELMHIGPEVFKGDRVENMGIGYNHLGANVLGGVATSTRSKEILVQHWIDDMKAMEKHRGNPGGTAAIEGDHRYPHHRYASFMVEKLVDDSAAETDVVSVLEDGDEVDASDDDARTVITAIKFPMSELLLVVNVEVS